MTTKMNNHIPYKSWTLIYPDGTESLTNYDPIEHIKQETLAKELKFLESLAHNHSPKSDQELMEERIEWLKKEQMK